MNIQQIQQEYEHSLVLQDALYEYYENGDCNSEHLYALMQDLSEHISMLIKESGKARKELFPAQKKKN